MLSLGYSDGTTKIYDVNNGKAIHRIVSEVGDIGGVTCLGWVDNHSHAITPSMPREVKGLECTPQTLFDLDIGSMLPRLSILPSSSGSYGPPQQLDCGCVADSISVTALSRPKLALKL
jgi:anaphase-promoting complex subunit 4